MSGTDYTQNRCRKCGQTAKRNGNYCRRCVATLKSERKQKNRRENPPRQRRIDPFKPTYTKRNENLELLGFKDYAEYLKSQLWADIRESVFESRGRKCWVCYTDATEIHHQNYEKDTLSGKHIGGLYPICHACHERVEFNDGKKVNLDNAIRRFCELAKIEYKTARQQQAIERELAMNEIRNRQRRKW